MEIFKCGKIKIANRFLITRKIGSGAFGEIHIGLIKQLMIRKYKKKLQLK